MTTFTIEIKDAGKLAGITAAREASEFNLKTDNDYIQFVIDKATESWASAADITFKESPLPETKSEEPTE